MNRAAEPSHRETAAQPETSGIEATLPSRKDRTSAPHRHITIAADPLHREQATAAIVPAPRLEQRIASLRAEIAAAERKQHGIKDAITSRLKTLNRLQAQLALRECGLAFTTNE